MPWRRWLVADLPSDRWILIVAAPGRNAPSSGWYYYAISRGIACGSILAALPSAVAKWNYPPTIEFLIPADALGWTMDSSAIGWIRLSTFSNASGWIARLIVGYWLILPEEHIQWWLNISVWSASRIRPTILLVNDFFAFSFGRFRKVRFRYRLPSHPEAVWRSDSSGRHYFHRQKVLPTRLDQHLSMDWTGRR